MTQTYTKVFQCQYQLSKYPFDTQVCYIQMTVSKLDMKVVTLHPAEIELLEEKLLTMFVISRWNLTYNIDGDIKSGVRMVIVLKRRIQNELLTTYLPSILLICITFATMHFKPFFFEAALTVNLTNMLVMTTIFISVMERLPSTAYIKHIDIWLIGGQLLPFMEVVILTMKEKLRDDSSYMNPSTATTELKEIPTKTRIVNHHGHPRTIQVKEQINVDSLEQTEDDQLEVINDETSGTTENPKTTVTLGNDGWIRILTMIGECYIIGRIHIPDHSLSTEFWLLPSAFLIFSGIYFTIGVQYYFQHI